MTAGRIDITVDGTTSRYGVGDRFAMAAGRLHSETIGPDGVTFIVSRRSP